ncbi:MAG: S8 family peptidase [Cyclobacteriaceae bacterium]|nr:S8 family peptidase [Cyclobacteriaceae bacterium]
MPYLPVTGSFARWISPLPVPAGMDIVRQIDDSTYIVRVKQGTAPHGLYMPADPNWKWSPNLKLLVPDPDESYSFVLKSNAYDSLHKYMLQEENITIIQLLPAHHAISITCPFAFMSEVLSLRDDITFIGLHRSAMDESPLRRHNLAVNSIYKSIDVFGQFGTTVSVKEAAFLTEDLDLKNISTHTALSHPLTKLHATEMATLIAGKGVTFHTGKGVSSSKLISTTYENLFPESTTYHLQYGTEVQNHSYGVGIENYYGLEAQAYDQFSYDHPGIVHVFSSGNAGEQTSASGTYANLAGTANLTGTFKQAKNVLVVGAVDSSQAIKPYSSTGPAYDGRIKPELVAYGGEGSSDAAALVSGSAAYLKGLWKATHPQYPDSALSGSLTRAILIAGARDIGAPGPDYKSGYGSLDLYASSKILTNGNVGEYRIAPGQTIKIGIDIPPGTQTLRIAGTWDDPPALIEAPTALTNDLDLHLFHPQSGATFLPWTLSHYPHIDSLSRPAFRGYDRLNTTEMVTLHSPQAGYYEWVISGTKLTTAFQRVSYAFHVEASDMLEWHYPVASQPVEAGGSDRVYWKTNLSGPATLELSTGNGKWTQLGTVDLTTNQMAVNWPDTLSTEALLRIHTAIGTYYSDTFYIQPIPRLTVDLLCDDRLSLAWTALPGISTYRILEEGIPYSEVAENHLLIYKSESNSPYYAVAPVFPDGLTGLHSYSINYTLQGAGCYLDNFLAYLGPDFNAHIFLRLSGLTAIEKIQITRKNGANLHLLKEFVPDTPTITLIDSTLTQGISVYQAIIWTKNGEKVESSELPVVFTEENHTVVFPNPVTGQPYLGIISRETGSIFQLTDTNGRLVMELELVNDIEYLPLPGIRQGLYLYRIMKNKQVTDSGKVIIR